MHKHVGYWRCVFPLGVMPLKVAERAGGELVVSGRESWRERRGAWLPGLVVG
jgi:hypothetical protein